jgi:hypothetical protein
MVYYHNGMSTFRIKTIFFLYLWGKATTQLYGGRGFPNQFSRAPSFNPHAFIEIEAKSCYDFNDEYNKLEKIMLLKTDIGHYGAFKTFYEILKRVYNASLR